MLNDCQDLFIQFEEASQAYHAITLRTMQQMFVNMIGDSPTINDPLALEGDHFSKAKEGEDATNLINVVFVEGELILFCGDYEAAAQRAIEVGEQYATLGSTLLVVMIETFHRAVALYAAALQTKHGKYKKATKSLRSKIANWAKAGNPNVQYYNTYLNAEQAALDKKYDDADRFYKDTIVAVTTTKHVHHKALLHERYADFLERDRNMVDQSKTWLKESIRFYKEWGHGGKVKALESRI